jgi:hypothetical protein
MPSRRSGRERGQAIGDGADCAFQLVDLVTHRARSVQQKQHVDLGALRRLLVSRHQHPLVLPWLKNEAGIVKHSGVRLLLIALIRLRMEADRAVSGRCK